MLRKGGGGEGGMTACTRQCNAPRGCGALGMRTEDQRRRPRAALWRPGPQAWGDGQGEERAVVAPDRRNAPAPGTCRHEFA